MEYLGFEIKNFKGIENVKLDLDKEPSGRIFTLVGLNESGKTTLLQALNVFQQESSESLSPLYGEEHESQDASNFVPKHRTANFNDSITVTARLSVDPESKKEIVRHVRKKHGFRLDAISDEIRINKTYKFQNSELVSTRNIWAIILEGRTQTGSKNHQLKPSGKYSAVWHEAVQFIGSNLVPPVLYFPSFAVDLPDRIYLSGNTTETDRFYRRIVQDILDSIDQDLDVDTHIVERLEEAGKDEKKRENAKQVVRKMSKKASKEIIKGWNQIFSSAGMDDKQIEIEVDRGIDEYGEPNGVYLRFNVEQGEELYSISERSLGFRWFFCFILFTRFRGERKSSGKALFLFDEPASNLHSAAQRKLLESFLKITATGCSIMYSTHSQYMINPQWLENAFVVRNRAIEYEHEEDAELNTEAPLIDVKRYRAFANENPSKTTYYQPILDLLEYRPSDIENVPQGIIVEGKSDYYMYEYMRKIVLGREAIWRFLPGFSSSSMDDLIGLYMGWNREFIVLLDDDDEGRKQKERYCEELGVPREYVWTIGEMVPELEGCEVEGLVDAETQKRLIGRGELVGDESVNKKALTRAVQELFARSEAVGVGEETCGKFDQVFNALNEVFDIQG